jgi:tRNA A64-2'-O-ribosylphosphate transferase
MAAARAASEPSADEGTLSIYKAARRIKRRESTLYNALRSVADDAAFVAEIAALWPALPLVANLRCGLWYTQPRALSATCYFKSTDGHAGNWGFSTARLNLHLALLAGMYASLLYLFTIRELSCQVCIPLFFLPYWRYIWI